MIKLLRNNTELIFWVMAVMLLGISNPSTGSHFTLCPLKLMGITWCPGCGVGHAMSFFMHGDVHNSLKAHWLGIPALIVTFYRIGTLMFIQIGNFKQLNTNKP